MILITEHWRNHGIETVPRKHYILKEPEPLHWVSVNVFLDLSSLIYKKYKFFKWGTKTTKILSMQEERMWVKVYHGTE